MSDCKHLELKKELVGTEEFYQCTTCPQKFKAVPWDGKVKLVMVQGHCVE